MTTSRFADTSAGRRILVRGVNWLGDAVMTTPALQRLREALPEAHITLLTHEKLSDLWQGHPSLDAIIPFPSGESPWTVAGRLRAEGFHTALVLPNSPRSALEVWLARIPQRVGHARRWRNWLLTQAVVPRPGQGRMPKRCASFARPSELRRLPSATRIPAPPIKSTTTSTWQPLSAPILSRSRLSSKSPPRNYARQRMLS